MAMESNGLDDYWDADFLDELERTLSAIAPSQRQPPPPPPQSAAASSVTRMLTSHSPPRELSQRLRCPDDTVSSTSIVTNSNKVSSIFAPNFTLRPPIPVPPVVKDKRMDDLLKDQEIERLKRELGRVSEELINMEEECSKLRKEREQKDTKLRCVFSGNEPKGADACCQRKPNLEYDVLMQDHSNIGRQCEHMRMTRDRLNCHRTGVHGSEELVGDAPKDMPPRKAVGVQTDNDATDLMTTKNLSNTGHYTRNLANIWDSPSGQLLVRNLFPELLLVCETDSDFQIGCSSSRQSSEVKIAYPKDGCSSGMALKHWIYPVKSTEAAKLSHFYFLLSKIDYDTERMEALLEALVELCQLDNEVIVYKSLRVLRVVLNYMFSVEKNFDRRENVVVEKPSLKSGSDASGFNQSETGSLFNENASETYKSPFCSPFITRSSNADTFWKKGISSGGSSFGCANSLLTFERMHQIVMRNSEESIRLEAVSVMNMILLKTNAYVERANYGQVEVFQTLSRLLRKESGVRVQKEAVHLLYLLLNCPKVMATFCSWFEEEGMTTGAAVFDGLADCLSGNGKGAQIISELKLRRNAIILLAFIASSRKSGFEILLGHHVTEGTSLLSLVIQNLASEIDLEASESVQSSDVFRERTLLIREALILLNRLASNPQYSTSVLRIITNNREMACLTIDVANRLSRKRKWLWQSDTMTRLMRESEIADLARMFQKRVLIFLGDII